MTPWLQDPDVTLYHGDVLATLREFPAESVDCAVTSPPYWGLRDYGTASWAGGDEECDHKPWVPTQANDPQIRSSGLEGGKTIITTGSIANRVYRSECGKCGATRIDQQLGLEPTPEQYVERMVEVFREVRRVLAAHGTVWLNLGDSYYAAGWESRRRNEVGAGSFDPADRRSHTGIVDGLKVKDLVGIPWRVAFALQADGWYLRSDIIWAKPNPMPESVTDRPTKAHEYVFLLSKQPRYFFDQEAVREKAEWARWGDQTNGKHQGSGSSASWIPDRTKGELQGGRQRRRYDDNEFKTTDERNTRFQGPSPADGGRNIRSVWEIATQPYPEAHFATFPEELARRCIAAGCPEQVCRLCGKARERIVEVESSWRSRSEAGAIRGNLAPERLVGAGTQRAVHGAGVSHDLDSRRREVVGLTDCGHSDYRPGIVLDPFMGSGTVAYVARKLGRHAVGIDLNESYLELAARRLQQQSLFAVAE